MVGQLLLALAILVTLHECGHFWAARFFKIRVEKFYLFFDFLFPLPNVLNFSLFKKKIGDTVYGLGWFPMGGYVQIGGMMDEHMDKDAMAEPVRPDDFRAKPAWQRLIVMIGGVVVNLILGIVIFIGIKWYYGEEYIPMNTVNEKIGIYVSLDGQKLGLKTDDKLVEINGKKIDEWSEKFFTSAYLTSDRPQFRVIRNGKDTTIQSNLSVMEIQKMDEIQLLNLKEPFHVSDVKPKSPGGEAGLKDLDKIIQINDAEITCFAALKDQLNLNKNKEVSLKLLRGKDTIKTKAKLDKDGVLGFKPVMESDKSLSIHRDLGFGQAFSKGLSGSFKALYLNIKGFGKLISGKVSAKNSVGGPIAIAQAFGDTWNWEKFWGICGMLSLVLAFMNILPIPALDGGHVMFLLWEMITGKPASDKVLYIGQMIGTFIVLGLLVFVFWVDIARLFGH